MVEFKLISKDSKCYSKSMTTKKPPQYIPEEQGINSFLDFEGIYSTTVEEYISQ